MSCYMNVGSICFTKTPRLSVISNILVLFWYIKMNITCYIFYVSLNLIQKGKQKYQKKFTFNFGLNFGIELMLIVFSSSYSFSV